MNMIKEVARLKELAKREASATYIQAGDEFGYECAVLNDMPELLAVLSGFQAGDMQLIDVAIEEFSRYGDDESRRVRGLLRRYRDMAQSMEATK